MSEIVVDTYKLNEYADRIGRANARITKLDFRMDRLYTKVGLVDLWNLLQADSVAGFSWKLLRCQAYLYQTSRSFQSVEKSLTKQDPTNFDKPPISGVREVIYDVGKAVKKQANYVKSFYAEKIKAAIESYKSHGTVYKIIQYGKATITAVKGITKITTGVMSLLVTGGMSTPVAILSVISGANDVYNAIMDAGYVYNEDYDEVGKHNYLKDKLKKNAGEIGGYFGNEKVGETAGEVLYYGIDLVTSLASLDTSMKDLRQLHSTDISKLPGEMKTIGSFDVGHILSSDLQTLKYEAKLAGYSLKNTKNLIENVGKLYVVTDKSFKVGKAINNIITVNDEDWENPVLEAYDTVDDVLGYLGKAKKVAGGIDKVDSFFTDIIEQNN